jgi:4-hydroxy 2-oxovalerate aldolase
MSEKIKIIDCTIRDGGHLNKWEFDPACVKASYYAAAKSGADYFEIGYRNPGPVKGLGVFGYSEDDFLRSFLEAPSDRCKLLVMIDAGKSDNSLFVRRTQSLVAGVRVAAYPYELEKSFGIIEKIHDLGYEVFLNLMASSELTKEHYDILGDWKRSDMLGAVYFADSFGSFIPADITAQIRKLRESGFTKIGFHGHNNLQMAFANTLQALADGATHVDASIYGMGRGSGNLPMEVLIGYLEKQGQKQYNTMPVLEVIERFYTALYKQFDWGYKIRSLLGGLKNIHPYYVDEMFRRNVYTLEEMWNALDVIKNNCPVSFSSEKLDQALGQRFYAPLTAEKAKESFSMISDQLTILPAADAVAGRPFTLAGKFKNRKILIVGNGPSIVKCKDKIEKFIAKENAVVLGLNYLKHLYAPHYHMFVSRKRFIKYAGEVATQSELMVPAFFGEELVRQNYRGTAHYIEMVQAKDLQEAPLEGKVQRILYLNVAIAALLTAYQMGASEIYAVGIDGYSDELQQEIPYFYNEDNIPEEKSIASMRYEKFAQELDRVNRFLLGRTVPFTIITPTSHKQYYRDLLGG